MHVLTHSPLQDYYCYYCAKHKVRVVVMPGGKLFVAQYRANSSRASLSCQAYCAYCHAAPQQLYYASQYSSYYATYFATFYAKYFSSRVVSETQ